MKIKFNFNLSAWLDGVEVEAESYEDAVSKLYQMSFSELLEEGFEKEFSIADVDGEILEKTVKARVYDLEYDLEEDNFDSIADYAEALNSLPDELVLTVVLGPNDDITEILADEITYQTGRYVNAFSHMIIEER